MDLQKIGQRILYVRTEIAKLPQREFVQRMGLGQSNISQLEKGQSLPSCFFLYSLHITYDVNLNWLMTGCGEVQQKHNYHQQSVSRRSGCQNHG
ncbi:helix-turn-helix transcriptional regulator [Cytophagaceae bacterium DM2B3-1]|uniref:Helix-turn-helix transcriptional regulator n=1 Tax=Xanthocytophaga flava TaxID=3048013 RepID=A0ABT7CGL5_9BACT|nr:helix-turn-helix transcriptional regulator [Xanthocytophaga flavus]MDJ1471129.1 helix-turn-helix transcriptional regulator [Xanthocytophaga flavus]MDJ1492885.1 helix-turn-helix transcriptional regulator [Xanthocytophaga flavus]